MAESLEELGLYKIVTCHKEDRVGKDIVKQRQAGDH